MLTKYLNRIYIEIKTGIFANFDKIFLSILISTIIKNAFLLVSFPESDILEIKKIKTKNINKRNQEIQEAKSN